MRGVGQFLVNSYGGIQPNVETTYFPRPFPEANLWNNHLVETWILGDD